MPHVIRPSKSTRVLCSLGFVFLAVGLLVGGIESDGIARPSGIAGGVLAALVLWRYWQLRVLAGGEGIVVVNWLSTHSLAWSDVDRFAFNGGLAVRRRGGSPLRVSAFPWVPGALPGWDDEAREAARELEALRGKYQARARRAPRGS